jgi:hypothetical protein
MGKKQEAIHAYRLALASKTGESGDVRAHFEALSGESADGADAPVLRRSSKGAFIPSPGEELSRMRTTHLGEGPHDSGNGVFTLVFSPAAVEEVKYVSGSESLKALFDKLKSAKYQQEFPDAGPVRLVRRAMVSCSKTGGCDAVLLLPDLVHAADDLPSGN